jgi:hypothetical protein
MGQPDRVFVPVTILSFGAKRLICRVPSFEKWSVGFREDNGIAQASKSTTNPLLT